MNLDLRIQESVRARDAAHCRSFFLKRLPYLTISSFLSLFSKADLDVRNGNDKFA